MSPAPERQGLPFRAFAPNAITALALCSGLTGVRFAISAANGGPGSDNHWALAMACIVGAGVLDGLDGQLARLLKANSRFGAELDSLSDNIAFGTAPKRLLALSKRANCPSSPSSTPAPTMQAIANAQ